MENRRLIKKSTLAEKGFWLATAFVAFQFFLQGCTKQTLQSFRYIQENEAFSSNTSLNTKMDILWIVDNSSSMDVSQSKLRQGFKGFAKTYLKPYWDIRIAAITTDTYLANEVFSATQAQNGFTGYLEKSIIARGGTSAWMSTMEANYATSKTLQPQWSSNLSTAGIGFSAGKFTQDVKVKNLVPSWGRSYSQLTAGVHDGPIAALCFETLPYFMKGLTKCGLRDDVKTYNNTGSSKCLDPTLLNTAGGETSENQCVNTILNNSIHSGNAIVSTRNQVSSGYTNDQWVDKITNDFMQNITTGTTGHGSERGLASMLQMLEDNEPNKLNAFFRPGSLRVIVVISDEDDQTMYMKTLGAQPAKTYLPVVPAGSAIAANLAADNNFSPWSHYKCDYNTSYQQMYSKYKAQNDVSATPVSDATLQSWATADASAACCSNGSCAYGADGTSCTAKTLDDGTIWTLSVCANENYLVPVKDIKSNIDRFFTTLDSTPNGDPNYFTVAIVPKTAATIKSLNAERVKQDDAAGVIRNVAVDYTTRYIDFVNQVGNSSFSVDIGESDYSVVLNQIGKTIIDKLSRFSLTRAPTSISDLTVKIIHANGSETTIPGEKLQLDGKTLIITDQALVLSMSTDDRISINYQPATAY